MDDSNNGNFIVLQIWKLNILQNLKVLAGQLLLKTVRERSRALSLWLKKDCLFFYFWTSSPSMHVSVSTFPIFIRTLVILSNSSNDLIYPDYLCKDPNFRLGHILKYCGV